MIEQGCFDGSFIYFALILLSCFLAFFFCSASSSTDVEDRLNRSQIRILFSILEWATHFSFTISVKWSRRDNSQTISAHNMSCGCSLQTTAVLTSENEVVTLTTRQ